VQRNHTRLHRRPLNLVDTRHNGVEDALFQVRLWRIAYENRPPKIALPASGFRGIASIHEIRDFCESAPVVSSSDGRRGLARV
jgi:hypothetical protein